MIIKNKSSRKKPFFVASGIILLAIFTVGILELTNATHIFHKRTVITASSNTKGEPASQENQATGNDSTSTSTQPGDQKSNAGGNETVTLLAPTGDFVSNHHPNLSGTPAPNTISSVCTTTAGASCTITFSKDGLTKSLATQTTDRGGSTYWTWKLQDIGLTAGSWKIQAVATMSGQTKSADDALTLEVAQ